MKVNFFLYVLALGILVGSTPAIAQDTMFISLGESLIHPDTPAGTGDILNTPGQVVGGMTGATWNLVYSDDTDPNAEEPILDWSNFDPSDAFVNTGRGAGGPGIGVLDARPGEVLWWNGFGLGSNGTYDATPDDPSILSGILSGPAGSQGHSWQKSAAIRIRDLPLGTYEVYATGVPYSRYSGFGAIEGQDVDMYIGTVFHSFSGEQNLENDLAAGTLTKTTLTHDNYTSWELGDNYARSIVTISVETEALMVAVDLSSQSTGLDAPKDIGQILASLGTVEIRQIVPSAGDFDFDGDVDGADFMVWQGDLGVGSLSDWQDNFGSSLSVQAISAVPEPTSFLLTCVGLLAVGLTTRTRRPLA